MKNMERCPKCSGQKLVPHSFLAVKCLDCGAVHVVNEEGVLDGELLCCA